MRTNHVTHSHFVTLLAADITLPIAVEKETKNIPLLIPPNTRLTCLGDFIRINYVVQVSLEDPRSIFGFKPILIPVRINPTMAMIQNPELK